MLTSTHILGFYSADIQGVFTHPGESWHTHVIIKNENKAGHVEKFGVGKGISIAPTAEREPDGRNVKRLSMLFSILLLGLLAFYIADKRLFNLAALMMKIDLFAFGGGFASLPLMLHEIVTVRGWIDHKTFMDGIALGQVTPGPIVITATFVGYMLHGLSGALAATLGMFTPSLLL